MLALAVGLRQAGHEVTLAAPRNFEALASAHCVPFHPFQVDVEELVRSDLGRSWLGHSSHSPAREVRLVARLVREWAVPMAEESITLAGTADLYISGVMTVDVTAALVRAGGGAHVQALLAPFHPSRSGAVGLRPPFPSRETAWNHLAGSATAWALGLGFGAPGSAARGSLGLRRGFPRGSIPEFGREYRRALRETPTMVGASEWVVPRPDDWPAWVRTTGYWVLPAQESWVPGPHLTDFLAAGDPPVYVGFGSMSTHDPVGTLRTIVDGLRRAGRRGVVSSGGADLASISSMSALDPDIHLVGEVSHEWLFPRVSGVIHHGGAGTTSGALRAGVPSAVVPHIGDQPYWGRRVAELGVGARPVPRHRLTAAAIGSMIDQMDAADVRRRARDLGQQLRAEQGVAQAVSYVERFG